MFPLKSVPTVIAGIPEPFLPVHGLETLSLYHCQFPSCTLEFSQKAATSNHIQCDHLNIALACLYCSFEHNHKLCLYSASTWEHHIATHSKENLPIHPDDPAFSQQFAGSPGDGAIPSTSRSVPDLPHATVIHRWAEASKHFLEEGSDQSTFHCPLSESSDLSPCKIPKCHIKQGPVNPARKPKNLRDLSLKMEMSRSQVTHPSNLLISPQWTTYSSMY